MRPKTPRWLSDDCTEAAKKISRKQIDLDEAAADLADAAIDKDDAWVRATVAATVAEILRRKLGQLGRLALRELEREADRATGATYQPGFDDVCTYFFPPDTFPPTAMLTEAVAYAYDTLGRAERHWKVGVARVKYVEGLIAAVGGNKDGNVTLGDAVRAFGASAAAA
jgi:hypothetical protein